jgi:hypothetical protein
MFAATDAMHLPLVIVDVSAERSSRRPSTTPRSSRATRLVASARTNVVRLVPGHTRLPFESVAR